MFRILLLTCFTLIFSFHIHAQVGVIESFDNGLPNGWTNAGAQFSTSASQSCTTNSFRANVWGTGASTTSTLTTVNYAGQSNGTDLNISFEYKIVNWSAGTIATPPGWGFFNVEYSTDAGATWVLLETINDANHVTANTCATLSYVIDADDVPDGSDFQFRIFVDRQGGDFWFYVDSLSMLQTSDTPPNCDAELLIPADGSTGASITTNLIWSPATGLATDYLVSVGTSPGDNDVVDNESTGLSTAYSFAQNLAYETTYYVTILPANANGDADSDDCQEFSFTTEDDPSQVVDCSVGPVNTNFCYGNDEDFTLVYTSNDGSSLNLVINSGNTENNFDFLTVIDTDGTTLAVLTGNNLAGQEFQSSGDTISVLFTSDFLISCQSSASINPIDITVSCATCTNPQASFEVVSDCINGPQFFVEVDVTDIGSASSLDVSDNQGSDVQNIDEAGLLTFGPFANGTDVQISVANVDDVNCVVTSPELTQEVCFDNFLDCSEPLNVVYCYQNNENTTFTYTSLDGTPLNLIINAGNTENNFDFFTVLDTDGTQLAQLTGNNLVGQSFQSTGDAISVVITSDGSVNCQTSGNINPIDFTVSCATCINPSVSYSVVDNCTSDNTDYFIEVNIDSLGDADSLLITSNQGDAPQVANAEGVFTFGPYEVGNLVSFTIENQQDANCVVNSSPQGIESCACFQAEPFCAPQDGNPLVFENISDSSTAPPGIDYGCLFSQPNPVWFYLVIEDSGDLEFEIVQSTQLDEDGFPVQTNPFLIDVDFIVWGPFDSPNDGCNDLSPQNQVDCSFSAAPIEQMSIPNAEEGQVYIVLITNFNGQDGFISLGQTNLGESGSGSTNCDFFLTEYGCANEGVTLVSEVEEDEALFYQWFIVEEDEEGNEDFIPLMEEDQREFTAFEDGRYYVFSQFESNLEFNEEFFTVRLSEEVLISESLNQNICDGDSLMLDVTPINEDVYTTIEYAWFIDGEIVEDETTNLFEVNEVGAYSVHISTVQNLNGTNVECVNIFDFTISGADFEIEIGEDQTICDADMPEEIVVDLIGDFDGTEEITYEWSTGEDTASIQVAESGIYEVTVTVNGCSASASVEYLFVFSPEIELPSSIISCDLSETILDATPSNLDASEVTYEWFYEGELLQDETIELLLTSAYGFGTYELIASAGSEDCFTAQLVEVSPRDITVTFETDSEDNTFCPGELVMINSLVDGIEGSTESIEYNWFVNGNPITSSGSTLSFEIGSDDPAGSARTSDVIELQVNIGGDCLVSQEIELDRYALDNCIIPQGMSPDGVNHTLDLTFLATRTGIKKLQMFNRYGQRVFEKNNYVNEFTGQNMNGGNLVTGTYFVVVQFEKEDPVYGLQYKGWIYINRQNN